MTYTRQSGPSNRVVSDENIFLLRASRSRTEYRYRQKLKSDSRRHLSIPHPPPSTKKTYRDGRAAVANRVTELPIGNVRNWKEIAVAERIYYYIYTRSERATMSGQVPTFSCRLYTIAYATGRFYYYFTSGSRSCSLFAPYPPPQPHRSRNIIRRPRPSDRFEIRVYTRGDGANTRREGGGGEGARALLLKELFTGRRRRLLN